MLAYISDVTVFGVFGEQMVKWLIFRRTHWLRDRLIPFIAIGKDGINVEHHTAKIEYTVAHHVADGKRSFGYIWGEDLVVHFCNIITSHPQINLVAVERK